MSPSAPELSVYRERKRGEGETRGDVTFWGITGKKWRWRSSGIIAGEVGRGAPGPTEVRESDRGEHLIFRYQEEIMRRTGYLSRSGRRSADNR
jgi:hypothetical protein